MISYAQNFEDVMLWRALKHIEQGFYIDVGAWSPDLDSVTRFFYENGWHGMNIEPNPEFYQQYLNKRERDINLKLALSDQSGTTTIYFVENPGLSSLMKSVAESHEKLGYSSRAEKVTVSTLADICSEHAPHQDIHFLKVDVEGLEKQVLLGNNWRLFRPWIVVVEATKPMSQEENHQEWENILLNADYQFAYADGLNRFYIANEHQELLPAFQYPPNVFDEFVLFAQVQVETRAHNAETRAERAENKIREAEHKMFLAQLELSTVFESRSWRITKPLRDFLRFKRWIMDNSRAWLRFTLDSSPHRSVKKGLIFTRDFLNRHPRLKQQAGSLLVLMPGIKKRLKNVLGIQSVAQMIKVPQELNDLSPRARTIYQQLEQSCENKDAN